MDITEIDRENAAKTARQVHDAINSLNDCISKLQQVDPEIPGQRLVITDILYRFVESRRSLERMFNL